MMALGNNQWYSNNVYDWTISNQAPKVAMQDYGEGSETRC